MLDEPYGYFDHPFPHRGDWAEAHGFGLRRTGWSGKYRPRHRTVCDLVSRGGQGALVDGIIDRLDALGAVSKGLEMAWNPRGNG